MLFVFRLKLVYPKNKKICPYLVRTDFQFDFKDFCYTNLQINSACYFNTLSVNPLRIIGTQKSNHTANIIRIAHPA